MLTADVREAGVRAPNQAVRLLPGFDQYVVAASGHAEHLLPGDFRRRVYRPRGWISFIKEPVWCAAPPGRKPSVWPRFSAEH